jgi:hypothetical protein
VGIRFTCIVGRPLMSAAVYGLLNLESMGKFMDVLCSVCLSVLHDSCPKIQAPFRNGN